LNGCTKTSFIDIQNAESCGDANVFVPNAFSPNGDGHNDEFKVFSPLELNDFALRIFNRWGEMVFESFEPELGWGGFYKGKRVPSGVYVAMISYKSDDSLFIQTITQTMTLIY
jgi:gliding motility-associated-like protein